MVLTICTFPYKTKADQLAREMNDKVRNLNEIIRQIQQRSVLPVRLLDVANMIKHPLPDDASSHGIHFDKPRGLEWLIGVFQGHINMLETAQFSSGPPPKTYLLRSYTLIWPSGRKSRLERQFKERQDQTTGSHADGRR